MPMPFGSASEPFVEKPPVSSVQGQSQGAHQLRMTVSVLIQEGKAKLMGPPPKIALLDLSMPPGRGSSRGGSRIGCRSTSWSVCTLLSGDSGDVGSRPPKGGVPPFDMAGAGLAPLLLLSPLLCPAAPPAVAAVAGCRSHRAARGSAAAEDYAATRPRGAGVACRDRNASCDRLCCSGATLRHGGRVLPYRQHLRGDIKGSILSDIAMERRVRKHRPQQHREH